MGAQTVVVAFNRVTAAATPDGVDLLVDWLRARRVVGPLTRPFLEKMRYDMVEFAIMSALADDRTLGSEGREAEWGEAAGRRYIDRLLDHPVARARAAREWLRRWYAVGKARCGRQGLVLIERQPGTPAAMSLLDELGDPDWLRDEVADLIRSPDLEMAA